MTPVLEILELALAEDDLRAVRALISRHLRHEGRTVEIGCGAGVFADLFAGSDYVGIDSRRPFVAYARRHRPGVFLCEDLAASGLPAGRFDQALAFDVLGPRSDAVGRAVLSEVGRLLVPGGRALLIEREANATRVERLVAALGRAARREALKSGFRRRVALLLSS